MQNASMPNMLIRDVPDEVHERLQSRAQASGLSLQRFLLRALADVADRGEIASAVAEWERLARQRGPRADAAWVADDLRAARDDRGQALDDVIDVARR